MNIHYKGGYKYQLQEDYLHYFPVPFPTRLEHKVQTKYLSVTLFMNYASILISKGYAWDGPSGPTFDTKNFMRGSLVHDAMYQLIRLEKLDKNVYRKYADQELYRICREDGMNWFRANIVYYGLRIGGNPAARKRGENKLHTAPW